MAAPVRTEVGWAKGNFEMFMLLQSGDVICRVYPPGLAFAHDDSPTAAISNHIRFMSSRNQGTGRWALAARFPKGQKFKVNTVIPCQLVLVRGVHRCPIYDRLCVSYYIWNPIKPFNLTQRLEVDFPRIFFLKRHFETDITIEPAANLILRYLNQISGPSISGSGRLENRLSLRDGILFHENKLCPDRVILGQHFHKKKELELPRLVNSMGSCEKIDTFSWKRVNSSSAKKIGLNSVINDTTGQTMIIRCRLLRSNVSQSSANFLVYVPIPTDTMQMNSQLFAVVSDIHFEQYNKWMLTKGENFTVDRDSFHCHMKNLVDECRDAYFAEHFKIVCNHVYEQNRCCNFIVVLDNRITGLNMKKEFSSENVLSYDIEEGFAVFRGFRWPYKTDWTKSRDVLDLLQCSFTGSGLKRMCTKHSGKFFMHGKRMSSMSNSSMGEVSSPMNHHYYSSQNSNTSLVPQCATLIRALGDQADSVSVGSGFINHHLIAKAISMDTNTQLTPREVCPHTILTMATFDKELKCMVSFSNHEHQDNDFTSKKHGAVTLSYLEKLSEKSQKFSSYLTNLLNCCELKEKIPLATTCCWVTVGTYIDEVFTHHQFFTMPSVRIAFQLSCALDMDSSQDEAVGASFYGGMISHCTSKPIWVDSSGRITTLCPGKYSLAWGRAGGRNSF